MTIGEPLNFILKTMAGATGLEPATSGVTGRRIETKTEENQCGMTLATGADWKQSPRKCHNAAALAAIFFLAILLPTTASAGHGRPARWCGWYMRTQVGHDPGPAFNLARNWAHWGRPASPGIGVMVVWRHHVGLITGRASDGQWIIKSGNDGHGVRERPRSVAGAIAFRAM